MSRILRRPMFRGGGTVDSYGKGITAPLVPGYQGGGQIGGGIVYGKPMADGRFGFEKPIIPNFTMPNSTLTKGIDLLKRNQAITSGAVPFTSKNIPGVVEEDKTVTTTDSDEGSKIIDTSIEVDGSTLDSDFSTTKRNEDTGVLEVVPPKGYIGYEEGLDKTTTGLLEDLFSGNQGESKKYKNAKERYEALEVGGRDLDYQNKLMQKNYDDQFSKGIGDDDDDDKGTGSGIGEPIEINAKDAIAQNQALFAELLGSDKARGQDIGDMLLRFSGSQGNTVGEKFQNYTRAESAAGPSRSEKIKQTAAGLAINDYVAGKRSAEQIDKLMRVEDYRAKLKTDQFKVNPSKDSWRESLDKTVLKYGGKEGKSDSVGIIAETLKFFEPGQKVFREDNVNPKNLDIGDLEIGITIVTLKNGSKRIIKKTGEGENDFVDLTSKYPV